MAESRDVYADEDFAEELGLMSSSEFRLFVARRAALDDLKDLLSGQADKLPPRLRVDTLGIYVHFSDPAVEKTVVAEIYRTLSYWFRNHDIKLIAINVLRPGSYGAVIFAEPQKKQLPSIPTDCVATAFSKALDRLKDEFKSLAAKGIIVLTVGGFIHILLPDKDGGHIQCETKEWVEFQHDMTQVRDAEAFRRLAEHHCHASEDTMTRIKKAFEID